MKQTTLKTVLMAVTSAIMLASPILDTQAHAYIKTMKLHYVNGQFANPPTISFRRNGQTWQWDNQGDFFLIGAKIKIHAVGNSVNHAQISLHGKSIWENTQNTNFRKFEQLVKIPHNKNHLQAYVSSAISKCITHGGERKKDYILPAATTLNVKSGTIHKNKNATMPIRVICHARPGSSSHSTFKLKLKQVKLYTVPAKPKCGQPVKLVSEFYANRAGKVDFILYRGDGKNQQSSVNIVKLGNRHMQQWSKTYKYVQSISRKYKMVVKGHSVSTDWVPITVHCN